MKHPNKKVTLAFALLTFLFFMIGTFALFTDRVQTRAALTAGTLDLVLSQDWLKDNETVTSKFKPGNELNFKYSLSNNGSLAVDVKETIVISFDKELTDSNPEFVLYPATVAADGTISKSSTPLIAEKGTYTKDEKTWYRYTYTLTDSTLNGSIGEVSGITSSEKTNAFVLTFRIDAPNEFQGTNIMFEYLAQALQHGNTSPETWTDAKVITESMSFGGVNVNVVPELDADSGS